VVEPIGVGEDVAGGEVFSPAAKHAASTVADEDAGSLFWLDTFAARCERSWLLAEVRFGEEFLVGAAACADEFYVDGATLDETNIVPAFVARDVEWPKVVNGFMLGH